MCELNVFFNIWLELAAAASDSLVLLLRYHSIATSLIDGSTEALLTLPTDRMLASIYEIHGSSSVISMGCEWYLKLCGYVKFSEYVTFGFILISNEILEFIWSHVV